MIKNCFFPLFLIGLPLFSFAQEPGKLQSKSTEGVTIGVSDQELIDLLMITVPGIGGDPRDMLRRQSIKPYMMPVRKVGARGSELSYALATCLEYYVNLDDNYKDNLSPDYIALSLQSSGKSVNLRDAFLFLVENGTVSAAIMPYDANNIPYAVNATQKFKIANYLHIFRDVTRGQQKIFEVRKALMRGNPVLIELQSDPSIRNLSHTEMWSPNKTGSELAPLIVVGYDEVEQAFEVQGCWGSSWGQSGYMKIRYDDFEKYAMNGYVFVPIQAY